MKHRVLMAVAVLALLIVPFGATMAQDEPIRVGILADQSGWLSLYGFEQEYGFKLGLLYAAGIDPLDYESIDAALAEVTVAGRPIELVIRDYGSESPAADADNAAALARELIESEFVDVIFGTPNSGAALQIQELTKPDNYNLLFLAGPAASPSITGATFNVNTFRICRNTSQDALALATQLDQFGGSYIILAVDTDFGRGSAAAFDLAFGAAGATKAGETILVPSDTVDFTPYLQQAMNSGASIMVPVWAGAGGVTLTQQTVELGVLDRMAVVSGTNSNDVIVAAPPILDTVAYIVYNYTLPQTEINDWLVERHVAAFNDVPDLFTECSFATAQALYAGLEATGGDPSTEAMIPALEGLVFEGPKGEYTIRKSDHQALAPQYVIRFKGIEDAVLSESLTLPMPVYELVAEIPAADAAPPCLLPEALADRCALDE